ncbi:Type I Iterative PKS [Cytospora paraplurivora]|uniref:Type I Iterative PKS n=1 Tax=Cytospora paraplurivora TaxID=2898453 RepID=A0AAN9YGN8_9PEZI
MAQSVDPPINTEPDAVMPIAIIGMACRFPGDSENVESLFEMLKKGENAWSEFPADRVNIDGFYHPSGNRQGSIGFRGAHFLKDDIKAFDAQFFNISHTEAQAIDPQQRVLLEVTYQALENAGYSKESLDLSETSVNVGTFVKDYEQVVLRDADWAPQYAATGTGAAILSNRISYQFNLRGPSQTVDTGCSASLVGVHNGCQDLRTGRSNLAIAAGVGMILTPATMMPMTALNFLGKDGKCFTFTNKAEGYGRGEGVGVVVLKRLEDAIRDNDAIRAVIRGSRVNQDGRTPGITMPSTDAQLSNIRAVYKEAGLDVEQTAYVECHGTGTPAGDPKESFAISQAFCDKRDADKPILIGSIKPNIGHLEGAAGVAGLIKAVLAVERGQITKNIYFDPSIGNPDIKFDEWKVKVPTCLTRWPMDGLRRASVNCFGFGGTNAHLILDDAGTYLAQRSLAGSHRSVPTTITSLGPLKKHKTFPTTQLILISSHEKDGITRIASGHAPFIAAHASDPHVLVDYAYTMSRRSSLEFKAVIVAQSALDLAKKLESPVTLDVHRFMPSADNSVPRLAMVFCGQGSQWHAMGRELADFEPFSNSLVGASKYLSKIVGSDFDLLQELRHDDPSMSRINEPKFAQPATTAIQVALVDLLKASRICPLAVVGHSSGEIAAAYAAGFITREDAWLIAFRRGEHAHSLQYLHPTIKGRMMAVGLSAVEAQRYIYRVRPGSVVVACENSPVSITMSGDEEQMMQIGQMMATDGIFHKFLAVTTAYHSQHMCLVGDAYRSSLDGVKPITNPQGPCMFSSVTGEAITASEVGPEYWARNLVSPVLFDRAFSTMYKATKPKVVIEVSPAVTLNRPVQEIMKAIAPRMTKGLPCLTLLKRNAHACVTALEALGEIWARGHPADFSWVWRSKQGSLPQLLVDLPPYPFNHSKTYWFESHLGVALRLRKHGREDLIGAPLAESTPQDPRWRGFFRLEENPWLADHQVQKTIIYPAAGLLAMALEAARQCSDPHLLVDTYQICNFSIAKPVIIPGGQHGLEHVLNVKLLKIPSPDTTHGTAVYSFSLVTKTEHGPWQENADGQFKILYRGRSSEEPTEHNAHQGRNYRNAYLRLRSKCIETINPRSFYEKLDGIGMNYGPLFHNIVALAHNQNSCISVVRIPDTKSKMPAQFEYDHLIHPATLDAMFQTVFAVGDESMVPSCIRQISFSPAMLRGAGAKFYGYATAQRRGFREAIADIVMSDETFSKPMVVVKGMEFIKLASSGGLGYLASNRHLCSEIQWQELHPVWQTLDDAFTFNNGAPAILLLPDGVVTETTKLLSQRFALPNVEHVRLPQLTLQHASKLCISLVEIDQPVLFDMSPGVFDTIKLLLKATPGLLWITRGAQKTTEMPVMAPFHGLARSIRSEDSSKRIITLDLGTCQNLDDSYLSASGIRMVFEKSFLAPDTVEIPEVEYSLRDGKLFGARLYPLHSLNQIIEDGKDQAVQFETLPLEAINKPLKLTLGRIGDVGSTYFKIHTGAEKLGANDVRIAVESTNLYQLDLETILGRSSESQLGVDVIGTVSETGVSVTNLPVGSLVVALAKDTLGTSVTVERIFVHQLHDRSKNRGLSPTALVAAYYRLNNVGGLSSGDTIFIHCAAGPFGDAAIRVARMLGATIFAGAGNPAHFSVLSEHYGLPMEHIIDTTDNTFPDQIMLLTSGEGVDYIFAPTTDYLEQSAQCIADNGHIFLLSNATLSKAAITPRHGNVSIHKFDLFEVAKKRPKVIAKAFQEVLQLLLSGRLGQPSPCLVHEERVEYMDEVWESMAMEPGRHLYTITFTDNSLVRLGKNPLAPALLNSKGTYVLVGGLGGLGKAVARLMADRGARHMVFLSRSGAKTPEDFTFLESLAERGICALALPVDIGNEDSLRQALSQANMPPIKGVIQCAAVIADAVWETMSYEDWTAATRPKMLGSWNLHNVLPRDMDFFIFLSSASGVIGNRGQGNYAAGNCFQDALARHRTSIGMKNSVSIDLGPVMGAGMLENDEKTLAILKASGFFMVMLDNFLFLVERAMVGSTETLPLPSQIVTGVGTGGLILQNQVPDPYWTETKMFEILNQIDLPNLQSDSLSDSSSPSQQSMSTAPSSQGSGKALLMALKSADSTDDAAGIVLGGCIEYLSVSLGMSPEDMDADKSLTAYGVDSLVTSSFRSWIFKNIGVKVNDMEVIGAASIMELARAIAEKGVFGL